MPTTWNGRTRRTFAIEVFDEPDERDVEERKECERAINDDTPTEPAGAISYDRNKKNCGIFQVQEANVSTQELVQSMTREEFRR